MKFLERLFKWGLYLSFLLPLGFTSWTRFPAHFGKTILFQMLVEILVILYLILWLKEPERWRPNKLQIIDWSILIFLTVLVLTSLTSVNFANSFWGNQARAQGVWTWLHFGAWYFLLRAFLAPNQNVIPSAVEGSRHVLAGDPSTALRSARGDNRVVVLLIINLAAVLVTLTALFQSWLKVWFILDHQTGRLSGIFGNPAFLAAYLVLAAALAGYTALLDQGRKWWWFGLGLLELITIYLTGTRGAMLGVAAGIVFFVFCLLFERGREPSREPVPPSQNLASRLRSKTKFLLLIFIFIAAFATLYPIRYTLYARLPATAQTRLWAWQIALQGWQAKPFFGWGPGNFEVPFNKYYNPQFLKYSFVETVWDKPHNWPLEILVTSGLLGLAAYLWLYFNLLKKLLHHPKPSTLNPLPSHILAAGLVGYFVQNLFLFETSNTLLLFFFIAALVSSTNNNSDGQEASAKQTLAQGERARLPEQSEPERERNFLAGKIDSVFACGCFLATVVIFFSLYKFNYLALKSSYYLQKSEAAGFDRQDFNDWSILVTQALSVNYPWLAESAITAADDLNKLDKANLIRNREDLASAATLISSQLDQLSKKYSDNALYAFWAGQAYLVMGEQLDAKYFDDSESALKKAQGISPTRQEIYFLLGRLYLLKRDFAKAIAAQEQAVKLAPEIGQSHWFLGLTRVAAGDHTVGLTELQKAWELDPALKSHGNTLYVIDLLAAEKKYDRVLQLYQELATEEPNNPNWYVKLAATYAALGDKKSALEAVNKAVELAPEIRPAADKFIQENKLK